MRSDVAGEYLPQKGRYSVVGLDSSYGHPYDVYPLIERTRGAVIMGVSVKPLGTRIAVALKKLGVGARDDAAVLLRTPDPLGCIWQPSCRIWDET